MDQFRVAITSGYWSTNIGNSFFNLGAKHVLGNILGHENVLYLTDLQGHQNILQKRKRCHSNAFDLFANTSFESLVLLGPILSDNFLSLWEAKISTLKQQGKSYMLLSCGTMKLSEESKNNIKKFLVSTLL